MNLQERCAAQEKIIQELEDKIFELEQTIFVSHENEFFFILEEENKFVYGCNNEVYMGWILCRDPEINKQNPPSVITISEPVSVEMQRKINERLDKISIDCGFCPEAGFQAVFGKFSISIVEISK